MKTTYFLAILVVLQTALWAQSPEEFSYQAVIRDADGKLLQEKPVGIRISVLKGSATGEIVYSETHSVVTNINGLISLAVGTGTSSGSFSEIPWSDTLFFLQTETDPTGGTNYTINSTSQFLSVPYALFATRSGGGWPVRQQEVLTESQTWVVPDHVTKITVELWGASGGGGGAGAYSYSYNLNHGGCGGSGGYVRQELDVEPAQEFDVIIGTGGAAGINATYNIYGWTGDTDGENGGNTWFDTWKAAGGSGGYKGSTSLNTINGNPGTNNNGTVSGYPGEPCSQLITTWTGSSRSYIHERLLSSRPGKGGMIVAYSINTPPTEGEDGCAVITFFE